MPTGYSRSPKLLKGAIIQFSAPLFVPIPNIIIFQYNPETMSRSLTPWAPPTDKQLTDDPKIEENLAQPYDPEESFNIALELDATDELENPLAHPQTVISGVADRIAALEMLLYPPDSSAIGGLVGSAIGAAAGATLSLSSFGLSTPATEVVKADRKKVPLVLFFFGPGRIVPVRITTFSVDEQAYNPLLYPIRAKVTVGLKVLAPEALSNDGSKLYAIAVACYRFTMAQKETLALARNAENGVDAIKSLLPF
jgi:hypothetical protein